MRVGITMLEAGCAGTLGSGGHPESGGAEDASRIVFFFLEGRASKQRGRSLTISRMLAIDGCDVEERVVMDAVGAVASAKGRQERARRVCWWWKDGVS